MNEEDVYISIGGGAFSDFSNLSSVNILDSVKTIGSRAFRNCVSLSSIDTNQVSSLGFEAF